MQWFHQNESLIESSRKFNSVNSRKELNFARYLKSVLKGWRQSKVIQRDSSKCQKWSSMSKSRSSTIFIPPYTTIFLFSLQEYKMSQRHRLDNKYTAPKKGSLQEKIKLAEESIVSEANSQRFKVRLQNEQYQLPGRLSPFSTEKNLFLCSH